MRTLRLTSKIMHGADVKVAQKRLGGLNFWNKNFHPGAVDGQYGEQTASSVYRAKFFLGYPKRSLNKSYGNKLRLYLTGETALPASYRLRKKRRKQASYSRKTMRLRALNSARAKLGLAESPQGSNKNWLVSWWYGSSSASAPRCNISVSHSYLIAGSKAFRKGVNWAYVPAMEQAARDGDKGLMRIPYDKIRPGDILTFNFDGGVADHVGMCEDPHRDTQ